MQSLMLESIPRNSWELRREKPLHGGFPNTNGTEYGVHSSHGTASATQSSPRR
jgi:hypothetical protein